MILGLMFFNHSCYSNITVPTDTVTVKLSTAIPSPTSSLTDTPEPKTTQIPTITKSPNSTTAAPSPLKTSEQFSDNLNPFTGLEVVNIESLNRRPVAVKVQLFPRGQRPPWGISMADIVYDYYQNNGVTRLTAIFYGNDAEQVGPIRSARLFDVNIIKMYKAIFVFGLADWRIYQRLQRSAFSNRLVVEKYGSCSPLCRIDPDGYNHLVLDTTKLSDYLIESGN